MKSVSQPRGKSFEEAKLRFEDIEMALKEKSGKHEYFLFFFSSTQCIIFFIVTIGTIVIVTIVTIVTIYSCTYIYTHDMLFFIFTSLLSLFSYQVLSWSILLVVLFLAWHLFV
jgi:hypothetical protein